MTDNIKIIQKKHKKAGVFVIAYGRPDKTENCLRSILMNTDPDLYELTLIDNGTEDDSILELFKSVDFDDKRILRIPVNKGLANGVNLAFRHCRTQYFAMLTNDTYVTHNWLENLITCMESDEKIGFVTAVSSNVTNFQEVDLEFKDFDEMQAKARAFNVSDPRKWKERLRLLNLVTMLRGEVIEKVGFFDTGYLHDFLEDDYGRRIRQAGYKLMLCGDVFVHHDHGERASDIEAAEAWQRSLDHGRKRYKDKFYGLDPWEDINNYEGKLIGLLEGRLNEERKPNILGVDVRCGQPILEIRNLLAQNQVMQSVSYAFTTDFKYIPDLQFVTEDTVVCDDADNIRKHYIPQFFDYIILGEPINMYENPISLMENLLFITKKGGSILFKLKNIFNIRNFIDLLGHDGNAGDTDSKEPYVYLSVEDLIKCLELMGVEKLYADKSSYIIEPNMLKAIAEAVEKSMLCKSTDDLINACCLDEYFFCIEK